jgi:hypothetical protein
MTGTLKRKNLFMASCATRRRRPEPKEGNFLGLVSKSTARFTASYRETGGPDQTAMADSKFSGIGSTLSSSSTLRLT